MKIQIALDRMTIKEAIAITKKVEAHVDWVEVGTSLIKEFGVQSIAALKQAFPNKTIVADVKTIDNALYEFGLCFDAGADVATVMGVAPRITIETCLKEAKKRRKRVMIDMLNTTAEQKAYLLEYEAILCVHTSKDEQEFGKATNTSHVFPEYANIAVAGGITLGTLANIQMFHPSVLIVGSAITKASDPAQIAHVFKQKMQMEESK